MADPREKLSDLANEPTVVSDDGGTKGHPRPSPVTSVEVESVQTDNEMDRETLLALGAIVAAGTVEVPKVCPGHLSLFELFCPSLLDDSPVITRADVSTALYVLHCGRAALTSAYRAILAREALDEVIPVAMSSAENAAAWMDRRMTASQGMAELRVQITEFNNGLPPYDFEVVANHIRRVISESGYGFQMIEETGQREKKTAESVTPNGSE